MKQGFFISGNWKMHKTVAESLGFLTELEKNLSTLPDPKIEVAIFAPFTALHVLSGRAVKVAIGAQNLFYEEKGAFTGEISPPMLAELIQLVLIGHSERRQFFKEDDTLVNRKILAAITHGLRPVLCIGETLAERDSGRAFERLRAQLEADLTGVTKAEAGRLMVAYEPIWAIGTGRTATPEQAGEAHGFIRGWLKERMGPDNGIRVIYGGSVNPENSAALLSRPGIDGVLVGGASLKLEQFSAIISHSLTLLRK